MELFTGARIGGSAEAPPSAVEKVIDEGIVEVCKARTLTSGFASAVAPFDRRHLLRRVSQEVRLAFLEGSQ